MSTIASSTSGTSAAATPATTSTSSSGSASTTASTVLSSTGIGTGLDVSSIVAGLTTAQGLAANNQLADRKATLDAQVSAYGTFKSALSTVQATLSNLETSSSLQGRTATLGDDTIATATATAAAIPATYSLTVANLATAASLSSAPVLGTATTVGTGTLTISVGGASADIAIDGTDNTLQGIAAAINSAPNNPGVTASILTTSDGSRLVLNGTATGAASAITVSQTGGDGGLAQLTYAPGAASNGLTQTQAATDANFSVNGFPATSASNQVSSVIGGVTLNLVKPTVVGTPTTLTVGTDTDGAKTSIGTFVTALNGLITSIQSLTSYDPTTGDAGPLLGNATLQSFQNQLSKLLDQVTQGASGSTSLASLGISAQPDGSYTTNDTTLANALSGNLSAVTGFFSGTDGVATKLDSLISSYTQAGGLLDSVNTGLQAGLSDVASQQTALNARLAAYSATLTKQYNAMDTAVALLKQTQTYLTAEFNPTQNGTSSSLSSGNVSS
jgi:flagellar hook-associated protein 2